MREPLMKIGYRHQVSGFRKNRIDRYWKLAIATPLSSTVVLLSRCGRKCRHTPAGPEACGLMPTFLGRRSVYRLQSLLSLGCLEGHEGAFFESLEPTTLYPRVVDEKVLATVVWGDKAVALLVAEPLYRSLGHTLCARLSLLEPELWMTDLGVCPPTTSPSSSLRVAL